MGRIAAPFGVKGWIRIQPNTAAPGNLLAYPSWWVGREGDWRETAVAEAKVQGRAVIARLEGCDDRDAAAALRGKSVAVPRAALPRPQSGEYYWADLIGLKVTNTAGQELGQVTGVLQTGANDVLVVQGERERLIPFIATVMREVDPEAGVVRVDWSAEY
ncbi:MAG: 16S rRNA processing protein RimM [Betaproteobacteria bacterium RIFCSPLOWO2_02_FULL_67_26]|nr:MAG: 16S rRNA processing protein RimM [Betaproteobacteria bacterium RIFCSPLOWO2_02_FULL_67_26]